VGKIKSDEDSGERWRTNWWNGRALDRHRSGRDPGCCLPAHPSSLHFRSVVFIAIWVVIVGNLDSLLRPLLIARGGGDMPLILVLFGVIGGAMAFGLIGLFLGPTVLAVGYSMLDEWSSDAPKLLLDGGRKSDLSTHAAAARSPTDAKTSIKE
jgi:hypothetical protein